MDEVCGVTVSVGDLQRPGRGSRAKSCTPGWRPFAPTGCVVHADDRYYCLLRLPLDAPPLRRVAAYRRRRFPAPDTGLIAQIGILRLVHTGVETDLSSS